jgi:endonuclease/exonuclease/phosphatase family metal-dependent hydrolase
MMLEAGYVDAYRKFHGDEGHTFTTHDPHVRLDYAFVPQAFTGHVRRCEVVTNHTALKQASDHLPLLTEIAT